jgi:acyl-CoA reductase-like NAD-dependent aldehyde dehydrogenase
MAAPLRGGLFLDNRLGSLRGRASFEVHDPSNGQLVGTAVSATSDDVGAAMESAERAQPAWEALGGARRAAILRKAAEALRTRSEELARLVTREMGKVLSEARSEVAGAVDNFEYYADFGRTLTGDEVALLPRGETLRLLWLPRGVVVGITPWNFPAATVTRKIAPALVGGNTMVLKPSSATPFSTLLIADVLRRAGLPPGVLNVVTGAGGSVGPALIGDRRCSTVTLTGSTESGIEILKLAAPGVVKCLLELGGKAPAIVEPDADLDWAARAIVWARFWNAGQACIAAERCYVHVDVVDRFLTKVARLVNDLRVGPGLSPGVDIGPLYARSARDRVAQEVQGSVDEGARVVTGGRAPRAPRLRAGAFYTPTLLADVVEQNPIAREEIFGPVLPILTYRTFDDVIERANHTRYGLSSYVFTRDASKAERAVHELRFGETYVNRVGPETPQGYHGGFRQSGLAGEGTRWGVHDYLQLKSAYVDWNDPHHADYFLPYRRGAR